MQVKEIMTTDTDIISSTSTIAEAAEIMREKDIGALPVYQDDRLIGMITDRDIVVRGLTDNGSVQSSVERLMSNQVLYCFDDQSVEEVLDNMGEQQIRRMPVMSRDKRLVGMVALADLVVASAAEKVQDSLKRISETRS